MLLRCILKGWRRLEGEEGIYTFIRIYRRKRFTQNLRGKKDRERSTE